MLTYISYADSDNYNGVKTTLKMPLSSLFSYSEVRNQVLISDLENSQM